MVSFGKMRGGKGRCFWWVGHCGARPGFLLVGDRCSSLTRRSFEGFVNLVVKIIWDGGRVPRRVELRLRRFVLNA